MREMLMEKIVPNLDKKILQEWNSIRMTQSQSAKPSKDGTAVDGAALRGQACNVAAGVNSLTQNPTQCRNSCAATQPFKSPPAKNLFPFGRHTKGSLTQPPAAVQCGSSNTKGFEGCNKWRQGNSSSSSSSLKSSSFAKPSSLMDSNSPIKTKPFTAIKDLRTTPIGGFSKSSHSIRHSTPKQLEHLPSRTNQSLLHMRSPSDTALETNNSNDDIDEWSNEWSEEHLQQAIDMETQATQLAAPVVAMAADITPPLFEDEDEGDENLVEQSAQSPVMFPRPTQSSKFIPYRKHSCADSTSSETVFRTERDNLSRTRSMSNQDSVQAAKRNIPSAASSSLPGSDDDDKMTSNSPDVAFHSPPRSCRNDDVPKMKLSPFSPKTSSRLSQSWSLHSPPNRTSPVRRDGQGQHPKSTQPKDVAKRLYADMKESPIQDGMPFKKRNDFNDSLF